MLDKIKLKVNSYLVQVAIKTQNLRYSLQNEKGSLQTFATIAGLTFVTVMLLWGAYQILNAFFPNFLNNMLQAIQSKFQIQ